MRNPDSPARADRSPFPQMYLKLVTHFGLSIILGLMATHSADAKAASDNSIDNPHRITLTCDEESTEQSPHQAILSAQEFARLVEQSKYNHLFQEIIGQRSASFLAFNLTTQEVIAGVNANELMPVASAIKGPILLYFLDTVDESVWSSVPVEFWNAKNAQEIPEVYRESWLMHGSILKDLWRMIVLSDNVSTGNVLAYAYQFSACAQNKNAITAFNSWAESQVGINPNSGLRQWNIGGTNTDRDIDPRFRNRLVTLVKPPRFYNNVSSAFDLFLYYAWLDQQASLNPSLHKVASQVLSIIPENMYPGFLENLALRLGGTPYSKDGYIGPEYSEFGEHLAADAGLIFLSDDPNDPNGTKIIIVSMGINAGDLMKGLYHAVELNVRKQRGDVYWPAGVDRNTWFRSAAGPVGENNFSGEKINFIFKFVNESEPKFTQGQAFKGDLSLFSQAIALWDHAFPNGNPAVRETEAAKRIMNSLYGTKKEPLQQIARSILGSSNLNPGP
jgi:hypothetical protein